MDTALATPMEPTALIPLTLVGASGTGKSTTGNLLLRQDAAFLASDGIDPCTDAIAATSDLCLTVYDTPGLDGANDAVHGPAIATHLKETGGVVALVQSHGAVDSRTLALVQAIAKVLGDAFATSCVLVTTKWPLRHDQSPEDAAQAMQAYHDEFQRIVRRKFQVSFAQCYAYNTSSEQLEAAFVHAIRRDLVSAKIQGIQTDAVNTWPAVKTEAEDDWERIEKGDGTEEAKQSLTLPIEKCGGTKDIVNVTSVAIAGAAVGGLAVAGNALLSATAVTSGAAIVMLGSAVLYVSFSYSVRHRKAEL